MKRQMKRLVYADGKLKLCEWALSEVVLHCVNNEATSGRAGMKRCQQSMQNILTVLAQKGHSGDEAARIAFSNAVAEQLPLALTWNSAHELTGEVLSHSLKQLRQLKPLAKPQFLKACVAVVQADGIVTDEERLLIYCVSQALDCPVSGV